MGVVGRDSQRQTEETESGGGKAYLIRYLKGPTLKNADPILPLSPSAVLCRHDHFKAPFVSPQRPPFLLTRARPQRPAGRHPCISRIQRIQPQCVYLTLYTVVITYCPSSPSPYW